MSNLQQHIPSGFGPLSTTSDVIAGVDLTGKVAIVTGGYSGLGLETVRTLAAAGATVVVPVRSPGKAKEALAGIDGVETYALDLLDPASIDAFAAAFLATDRPLHILINSAGIMATPLARDARGYESQFSANHLGHFQLTVRLWPALRQAGNARVVAVSSRGHRIARVDFDDIHFANRPYDKWLAYGQAKTANVLFAVGLDARGRAHGVRAFALHPGTILTALARSLSDEELNAFGVSREVEPGTVPSGMGISEGGDYKTIAQGAATAVWCATSSDLADRGGVYCENTDIADMAMPEAGVPAAGVTPWAIDPVLADRLWAVSEAMSGVRFECEEAA
jgi:NAD(P)-dependent dehydrogenase (short-subunit alcohol dehydrogenase family)